MHLDTGSFTRIDNDIFEQVRLLPGESVDKPVAAISNTNRQDMRDFRFMFNPDTDS